MYQPGTILVLKEERGDDFPYNRVEVVGQSPVSHGTSMGSWSGVEAQGVVIKPAGESFAQTLDEPFGKLQELYKVESVPEPTTFVPGAVTRAELGPSPEEVFKAEAKAEPSEKRQPTPLAAEEGDSDEPQTDQ